MPTTGKEHGKFVIPPLRIERLEVALSEQRYTVILKHGKRLIVTSKIADIIFEFQKGNPPECMAQTLSAAWGQPLSIEDLYHIIEQYMVPKGLAYCDQQASDSQSAIQREPFHKRLLAGHFYWWLIKEKATQAIGAQMSFLYDRASIFFALILIVASRWLIYSGLDWQFYKQMVLDFSATEYLFSIGMLAVVVLVHEFGHVAAQVRFGLPAGAIGFQVYHFMPAFFANVDASWSLKPSRRIVVDIGGLYFQSLAASGLCLIYLGTNFTSLLSTVLVSDTLCLITLNPFLRFDGYWLLADVLALPNLQRLSDHVLKHYWRRITRRTAKEEKLPAISRGRLIIVTIYAVLKYCFFLFLTFAIIRNVTSLYKNASGTVMKFASSCVEGLSTFDIALTVSSLIRLILFILLLLAMINLLANVAIGLGRFLRLRLKDFNQAQAVLRSEPTGR